MTTPIHATCVAIAGRGVLLTGPPGAGKSDLALRLIDRGARLVSDDGVLVRAVTGRALASAPATIADRIEIRGLGILPVDSAGETPLALHVDLAAPPLRMPEHPLPTVCFAGVPLPSLALAPLEASAPIKVERALALHGLPA